MGIYYYKRKNCLNHINNNIEGLESASLDK